MSNGMKKIPSILSICVLIMGTSLLMSCKKGENDPALSFLPRKTRILGDWFLQSGETRTTSNGKLETVVYTDNAASVYTESGSHSYAHKLQIRFENDGKFNSKQEITYPGEGLLVYSSIGHWSFLSRNKSAGLKNKEALSIRHTTYMESGVGTCSCTLTSTQPNSGEVWVLDQLRNKEIVFKVVNNYTGPAGDIKEESTRTFKQE